MYRDDGPGKNWVRICRNVENSCDASLIALAPEMYVALRLAHEALVQAQMIIQGESDQNWEPMLYSEGDHGDRVYPLDVIEKVLVSTKGE